MSLRVSTPEVIDRLRAEAADDLRQPLMEQADEYDVLRRPDDPAAPFDFMEQHRPGLVADFDIRRLPDPTNRCDRKNYFFIKSRNLCLQSRFMN
jgi:hypothetical protein